MLLSPKEAKGACFESHDVLHASRGTPATFTLDSFVSKGFLFTFKWRKLPDGFLGKAPLIWGNAVSRNVQCQGVKGFSLITLEPKDGGGESRPALRVLQPCSPRCTFGGRKGPMWMVGTGHSGPGKTGQREGMKLADLNGPHRILFHHFSLYSRFLNIQGSLLVIVWISNVPQRPNS